ncbi:hypothetical protein BB560_000140 [Smittium megazygosporum]|uniref:Rho-GAP domain-containing protein n=1 Tax=Smittium megazygosporum TaxID=133381 RepID=A0A2T9ZL68_9FUNG|nr:hypothetical protein BB560_000140 [Smittium megazygosporum]
MDDNLSQSTEFLSIDNQKLCTKCNNFVDTSITDSSEDSYISVSGYPFHLKCFTCSVCNKNVANGFCQINDPDQKIPLLFCKQHYYQSVDLLCASCEEPLEGLYVTALNKKYHPNHFTCSLCPTEFGPDGTYYEFDGKAYCLNHYIILVSSRCSGCRRPIIDLYLEFSYKKPEERWHPECYMIHKFWNVRLYPSYLSPKNKSLSNTNDNDNISLNQISQIWSVLSSFEESTAACISDMLLYIDAAYYIEGLRQAERFIMHVDVLFTAIDDLEDELSQFDDSTGLQHTREPKLLCKKIVSFFFFLTNSQNNTGSDFLTNTFLTLVTSIAHYLKVLIRVALKCSLKAEIEYSCPNNVANLLDRLSEPSNRNKWNQFRSSYQTATSNSDLCASCNLTIESEAIFHQKSLLRWHLDCFKCSICSSDIQRVYPNCYLNPKTKTLLCPTCGEHSGLTPGVFKFSSQLEQYSFLMRVALKRLYSLLKYKCYVALVNKKYISNTTKQTPQPVINSKDIQLELDSSQSDSVSNVSTAENKSVTSTLSKPLERKNLFQETLAKVAPSYGIKDLHKTPIEVVDYAFDVGLHMIDYQVERNNSVSSAKSPIELANTFNAKVQSIPNQRQIDNAATHRSKVYVVSDEPLQTKIRNLNLKNTESHFIAPKYSSANSKPKQLKRNNKLPSDRSFVKDAKKLAPKPTTDSNSPPKHSNQISHPSLSVLTSPNSVRPSSPKINVSNNLQAPKNNQSTASLSHLGPQQQSLPASSKPIVPKLLKSDKSSFIYMSDLNACELPFARFAAAARLSIFLDPQNTLSNGISNDLLSFIGISKKTGVSLWNKMRANLKQTKAVKHVLMERQGVETHLGTHGQVCLNIPRFFDKLIQTLSRMDLTVEGIFRKNGNIRRLREVSLAVDKGDQSIDLAQDNSVQVAALLKKFLREIPDPLIPFKMFGTFLEIAKIKNPSMLIEALRCVILLLPQPNRDVLNVLLTFLQSAAAFSDLEEGHGSRMNTKNLGTVIAPNILYPDVKESAKDELHWSSVNYIITFIIENGPMVWEVPSTIHNFIQNHVADLIQLEIEAGNTLADPSEAGNIDLDYKELMRRCTAAGLLKANFKNASSTNNTSALKTNITPYSPTNGVLNVPTADPASTNNTKPNSSDPSKFSSDVGLNINQQPGYVEPNSNLKESNNPQPKIKKATPAPTQGINDHPTIISGD